MGTGFEQTQLWSKSLAPQTSDSHSNSRSILAASYHGFRERAALIAAEIPQDLREYTVHDVTHLDALWEMADQICGDSIALTPTEAFVLGGAFLIHDLGMGLAAWPGGLAQLRGELAWNDILSNSIRRCAGAPATPQQMADPPAEALKLATEIALRERHAFHAKDLALTSWESKGSGAVYHLIEDTDLRQRYGELIGEIAASHWWQIDQVAARFSGNEPIGAPIDCPDAWTVDELKLACLMRVADAAHLDERRAPGFLRAIRSPTPYSDLHWTFQGFLQRPRRSVDSLVYTSARAFGVSDAQAWWVCFESLEMVDRELRGVDCLLVDRGRTRFAAHGVRGVESPARMAEYIRTSEWTPIDARPRIENVPALVRKLGGESLYGDNTRVALRELIQNARDASKAIETLLSEQARPICVELSQDHDEAWWLTVNDSGVGMSTRVLSETLLDFGESLWGSDLLRREFPGLGSSLFSAVGRFGIGFYSVFMLGDHVTVTSRRYDGGSAETKVLEFGNGVASRPLLRPASGTEVKHIGGTSVKVKLRIDPTESGGLLAVDHGSAMSLAQAVAMAAPALDCDLHTKEPDQLSAVAVTANDWLTLSGQDLIRRICANRDYEHVFPNARVSLDYLANRLTTIEVDGKPVARIALAPAPPVVTDGSTAMGASACVVIGGLFAGSNLGGVAGVVLGSPTTADRLGYDLNFASGPWAEWATDQAARWSEYVNQQISSGGYTEEDSLVRLVIRLGGSPGEMIIGRTASGPITANEIHDWAAARSEIVVLNGYAFDVQVDENGGATIWNADNHRPTELYDSVLLLGNSGQYGSWDNFGDSKPDITFKELHDAGDRRDGRAYFHAVQLEAEGLLLRRIADAWSEAFDQFLIGAVRPGSGRFVAVGTEASGTVSESRHASFVASRGVSALPTP